MEKKERDKAFQSAENELKNKEIENFKEMVKATLEKLESKKKVRHDLDKEIQILKKDIDDLKAGRLDKIAERQSNDVEAEEISIIKVKEIIKEVPYPIPYPSYPSTPWYRPWEITWCGNSCNSNFNLGDGVAGSFSQHTTFLNASEAKYNTPGSYVLDDGTVKNI